MFETPYTSWILLKQEEIAKLRASIADTKEKLRRSKNEFRETWSTFLTIEEIYLNDALLELKDLLQEYEMFLTDQKLKGKDLKKYQPIMISVEGLNENEKFIKYKTSSIQSLEKAIEKGILKEPFWQARLDKMRDEVAQKLSQSEIIY